MASLDRSVNCTQVTASLTYMAADQSSKKLVYCYKAEPCCNIHFGNAVTQESARHGVEAVKYSDRTNQAKRPPYNLDKLKF